MIPNLASLRPLIAVVSRISAVILAAGPLLAQNAPVNFSNGVFGTTRLVYDPTGEPLVGTNYYAQVY